MNVESSKPIRGRPKTLDRSLVLQFAMMQYWSQGARAVSVNNICKGAEISKPGLYREFGNEDKLQQAALIAYFEGVLSPLFQILEQDRPFGQCLEDAIAYASQDRTHTGMPDGCLLMNMTQCRSELGPLSQEKVDFFNNQMLQNFADWVSRAKVNRQFKLDISTDEAALYINTQINAATELQKSGKSPAAVGNFLRLALSVLA